MSVFPAHVLANVVVYVVDPSVEMANMAQAIRSAGFQVVDVPLSMLTARASLQVPQFVLLDAETEGAGELVAKLREVERGDQVVFLFFGHTLLPVPEGSEFFFRPVDELVVLDRMKVLARERFASLPAARSNSNPPPSVRPVPLAAPSVASLMPSAPPSLRAMHEPLSMELSRLLSDAEDRVAAWSYETLPPTPEEELEAVIPEEYLRSLDAPIAALEEDHEVALQNNRTTTAGGHKQTTGGGNSVRATDAPRNTHTSSIPNAATDSRQGTGQESRTSWHEPPNVPAGGPHAAGSPTLPPMRLQATLSKPNAPETPATPQLPSEPPPGAARVSSPAEPSRGTESSPPTFLTGANILAHIARTIVARKTGGICFVTKGPSEVLRRVLLRDGDFMVVVSSAVEESLVAFLIERGDLSPDHFELVHAIPAFGKRAVAPLIARGLVTRDQMWALLRAHAEWILSRIFCLPEVFVVEEAEVPKRILEEDPVFGGSTGAEVFVDVVRRILPPEEATRALGGAGAVLRSGPERNLAGELRGPIAHFVEASIGRSLADTNVAEDEDTSPLVFALAMLGVVEVNAEESSAPSPELPETDVSALRERIKRRYALVEDGDYFSILGIPRSATSYEIRRAYTELRRAFEPSTILTPETADLQREVKAIVRVLNEAFELLRDDATRKRYRAALESVPGAHL